MSTLLTDKAELEGIVNELDEIVQLNEEFTGDDDRDSDGEPDEHTAIRRARDILKALAETL
jgi:hypothetical protein